MAKSHLKVIPRRYLWGHVLDINLVKNVHHQQEISHLKTTLEFSRHSNSYSRDKRYLDCWMKPRHFSNVCLQPLLSPLHCSQPCALCFVFVLFNCVHASCRSHDHQQDKPGTKICLSRESEYQLLFWLLLRGLKKKHFNCTQSLISFSVKSRKKPKKKTNKKNEWKKKNNPLNKQMLDRSACLMCCVIEEHE